jgi:hypothetical protein
MQSAGLQGRRQGIRGEDRIDGVEDVARHLQQVALVLHRDHHLLRAVVHHGLERLVDARQGQDVPVDRHLPEDHEPRLDRLVPKEQVQGHEERHPRLGSLLGCRVGRTP